MNYNQDVDLLGKIIELYRGWKKELSETSEKRSKSFYEFLRNVVDANNKDIDFLKLMLKLYIEHKEKIDDTISYFLENSKNYKAKVDFEELLKIYDEYKV